MGSNVHLTKLCFVVSMKLGIASSVVARNLTSNITTEEDIEKVININNECKSFIEHDEESDSETTLNLELQGNDNTNETETYIMMEE